MHSIHFVSLIIIFANVNFRVSLIGDSKPTNSENGWLRRDGNTVPIQTRIILQNVGFRFILAKMRFPVEKDEDKSGAWQQRVKLPITVATRAKLLRCQSSANKLKIAPKSAKPSAFWSRRFSKPAKPAKPAVFGIGESIKHKFWVF